MTEQRTQIDISWLRKFKNSRPQSWSSKKTDYTITVKQDPQSVYEAFKQKGLKIKLSKISLDTDWTEISSEEIKLYDFGFTYRIELADSDKLNLTFNDFNDIVEQWEVEDVF